MHLNMSKTNSNATSWRSSRARKKEAREVIAALPVKWIEKGVYTTAIGTARRYITHEADLPILACSLATGYNVASGDKHLLSIKPKIAKVWKLGRLIQIS